MDLLTVNQDKCLRCGICVECCPSCILSMGENGPECNFDRGCMSCGQCVAICPVGALDNKYTPLAEQRPVTMPLPTPEVAYEFLRMRRSVRNFKPQHRRMKKLPVCWMWHAMRRLPAIHRACTISLYAIRNRSVQLPTLLPTGWRTRLRQAPKINVIFRWYCALTVSVDRILSPAMRPVWFLRWHAV